MSKSKIKIKRVNFALSSKLLTVTKHGCDIRNKRFDAYHSVRLLGNCWSGIFIIILVVLGFQAILLSVHAYISVISFLLILKWIILIICLMSHGPGIRFYFYCFPPYFIVTVYIVSWNYSLQLGKEIWSFWFYSTLKQSKSLLICDRLFNSSFKVDLVRIFIVRV